MLTKKNISELFWVVLGNTISILGILIMLKLFTKQLDQVEYGIYYLSLTVSIFINQIFFGPLGNGVSRFLLIAESENDLNSFLYASYLITKKIIYLLTILFLVSLVVLLYKYQLKYLALLFLTYISSILIGFTTIIFSLQNIKRERKLVAKFQIFDAIIKLVLIYILFEFFDKSANTVALGIAISSLIVFIMQLFQLKRNMSFIYFDSIESDLSKWNKKIFFYSYPFAIWGIFTWAQISSDRWFLELFSDSKSIAMYAVLFQIGYYPLTILMGYIVQIVTPILFTRAGDGLNKNMLKASTVLNFKVATISIICSVIGLIFISFFHNYFIVIFTSPKYYSISHFLPYMVFSGGLFATSQILSLDFLSQLNVNKLMFIKISTSLIGLILSYFLIKKLGLKGAIFSNLLFSGVYLIVILSFIMIKYKKNNE
ncbi:MAG: lipopolysaccharide biosynthesis protein [Flavobacterium sp.]